MLKSEFKRFVFGNFIRKGSLNSFGESLNNSSGTIDGQQENNTNNNNNTTMQKRETLHSRFEFIKVLGKGTYGKVKLANDKRTDKQVKILFLPF